MSHNEQPHSHKQQTMKRIFLKTLVGTAIFWAASIHADDKAPFNALPAQADGAVIDTEEYLYLDSLTEPAQWAPAEAEARKVDDVNGHPALTFHIDVDHHAGEPKYPIGWPRMYMRKPNDIPWKDYDKLEFKVLAKIASAPATLPNTAFSLKFTGAPKKSIEIPFGNKNLKLGEWVQFSMPLSKIEDITTFASSGFYICESHYSDKEVLDFTFAEIRLVRSSFCKVTEMETQGVRYDTNHTLPVKLTVFGPASDGARGIPFQIAQGGRVLRLETLPVARGEQTIKMDISELHLKNGDYTLTAFPNNPDRKLSVSFKVIDSPF